MNALASLTTAQWLSVVALIVGLPAATYYPFMFLRIRFWESDIGQSMFLKGFALALVMWVGFGSIFALIFAWEWFQWVRTFSNWILVVAVWVQVLVMRKVQKSGELHERMRDKTDGRHIGPREGEPA